MTVGRLSFGEDEETGDPLAGNPDHPRRAPTPAPSSSHGVCGCWHTGQYTAALDMMVRHRMQYFPDGGAGIGPVPKPVAPEGAA